MDVNSHFFKQYKLEKRHPTVYTGSPYTLHYIVGLLNPSLDVNKMVDSNPLELFLSSIKY